MADPFVLPGGFWTKDGDTFGFPDGRTMRLQGVDTAETQKMGESASDWTPAKIGADTQHAIVRKAIVDGGFTTPLWTGQKDATQERDLGDLINPETGARLSSYLLNNRLANPMMTTQDQQTGMAVSAFQQVADKLKGKPPTPVDAIREALNTERTQFPMMAKPYANTAAQYGDTQDKNGNNPYYAGAGYIRPEEDYRGDARNNFTTGLKSGYKSAAQGAANILTMLGTTTGSEYLTKIGQDNAATYGNDMINLPRLKNGEALDEKGNWKLDSFSKVADYVVGTAASSTPQMALALVAAAAAPATFGASLSVPAMIYAGQTYENQKVKDVGWAVASGITQSVIETFGITGKFTSIFKKDAQEAVIRKIMEGGVLRADAEKMLISKIQADIAAVSIASHAVSGGLMKKLAGSTVDGVLNEAPEEMAQELTQYFGEQRSFDLPTGQHEQISLKNRILAAGIGGAALGPVFGGARTILKHVAQPNPNAGIGSDAEFRNKFGGDPNNSQPIPTAKAILDDAVSKYKDEHEDTTLETMKAPESFKRSASGLAGGAMNWFRDKGISSLADKWSNTVMGAYKYAGDRTAALATLLGSNRAFNGGSIEEQQAHVTRDLQNAFGSQDEVTKDFGMNIHRVNAVLSDPKVQQGILKLLDTKENNGDRSAMDALKFHEERGDLRDIFGIHTESAPAIAKYADRIVGLLSAYNDRNQARLTPGEFINMKPVDKNAIQRNQGEFTALLMKHLGVSLPEAQQAVTRILGDPTQVFITDPFEDMMRLDTQALTIRDNLQELMNDPTRKHHFAKYLSHDVNENAYGLAAQGAARYVNANLIGHDGEHLAKLIRAAVDEGEVSSERGAFMAYELSDWLSMRRGTYHEVKNPYVLGALNVVNFLSTVSSLPLAAISSTVEFAQVYRHLTAGQAMSATRALLHGATAEISGAIHAIGGAHSQMADKYHHKLFQAGFQSKGDIGKRNDVVTGYFQKWTEGFFKITGLTSVTNITRYAKLSIGADAIQSWVTTIKNADPNLPQSQAVKDAKEKLIHVGVSAEMLVDMDWADPNNKNRIDEELSKGTHNFIIEAVVHPTKMNRPKFYSDPYLQLFTQFQGYTSAYTANIIPRLIKDLRKTGSADQANAAASIAIAIALTYLALSIKDTIKYGESPPQWLKDDKRFQRYIGQMGILGSSQRIWDTVSPQIEHTKENDSILTKARKQITDQAPALAYIGKLDDAISADPGQKTKALTRVSPIFGTSPAFAAYIQKQLGDY